ncbi:MAG: helix-turn-helix domain-containing protein [Thermomicrobiales bacterium]
MHARSSLSDQQRATIVALFEAGHGRDAVATRVGVSRDAVRTLDDRWRIHGGGALVTRPTKQSCSLAFKLEVVQRFLAGETKLALAQAFDRSSPQLVAVWVHTYRHEGEDGLRPAPKGRPRADPDAPARELSELEQVRRENARLRAEVASLGKLRALSAPKRR